MGGRGPRGDRPNRRGAGTAEVILIQLVDSAGLGSFTIPETGILDAFLIGGGASGSVTFNSNRGGGAGATSRIVKPVRKGQSVSYGVGAGGAPQNSGGSPGNNGGDTWLQLPSGMIVRAGGGRGLGPGGTASGGIENTEGAASGASNSAGASSVFFPSYGNFSQFAGAAGSAYGAGTGSAAGGAPGAGSGGTDGSGPSGPGGVGRLIYILSRLA